MFSLNKSQPTLPTPHTPSGLEDGWEFKIVQSSNAAFRKPDVLRKVMDEEAQAGWILLEKIDDRHLRFKRPTSARADDHRLSFDAYRTNYGTSAPVIQIIFWLMIVLGAIGLYIFFMNPK